MFKKVTISTIVAVVVFSCKKIGSDVSPETSKFDKEYELSMVAGFEDETKIPFSLGFDSNDNLWTINDFGGDVGYYDNKKVFHAIKDPLNLLENLTLSRITMNGNNVQFKGFYQKNQYLFYYNDNGVIKNVLNPFADPQNPYADTGFIYVNPDGKYIVNYNDKVYLMDKSGKYEQKFKEIQYEGNQLQGNITAYNGTDRIYYKPYFSFENLAYLDMAKGEVKIKSESFVKDASKFGYGDGKLPDAFIGEVTGIAVDKDNNVYFLEYNENNDGMRLRVLTKDSKVKTLVGGNLETNTPGVGDKAGITYAQGLAVNSKGEIYIATSDGLSLVKAVN